MLGSCLSQARYQQRQLADKEQRLLQLYEERRAQQERAFQRVGRHHAGHGSSAGSSSSNNSQTSQSSLPCGKVSKQARRHPKTAPDLAHTRLSEPNLPP